MNPKYAIALVTGTLLSGAIQAQAGVLVFPPRSYAYVAVEGSTTEIDNGIVGATSGPGTSTSHSPDNYLNSASASVNGANANATADLHTANLSAFVSTSGPGSEYAESRINDTLYFTNGSAGTLTLPFTFTFAGSLTDTRDFSTFASGIFGFQSVGGITLAGSGASAIQTLIFGISNNGYIGAQQGGAFFFNAPDNIDLTTYTVTKSYDALTGLTSGSYSATLLIPTGESSLGIDLRLLLRSCWNLAAAGTCDFGPGANLSFGALSNGLAVSSASNVFPVPTSGGAGVPEPATWGMMLGGFGLAGGALRRRRATRAAAVA